MVIAAKPRKHHRINYALAATLVASGVTLDDAAAETGAKNANVLKVGLRRLGVTATNARSLEPTPGKIATVALRVANRASEVLRNRFSDILDKHAQKLAKVPAKSDLKHLKRVGEALEPLARTAKIVHDWGSSQSVGLIAVGAFAGADQEIEPAIEVASVSDTPSGSVSVPEPIAEKPQDVSG